MYPNLYIIENWSNQLESFLSSLGIKEDEGSKKDQIIPFLILSYSSFMS